MPPCPMDMARTYDHIPFPSELLSPHPVKKILGTLEKGNFEITISALVAVVH